MNPVVPQLQQQLTESLGLVSRYHRDDLDKVREELERLFAEQTPQVMLYGAFNAGKSTLVNALLGREEAAVQDIPTTFQVDRYPWNGLCLLDTPGINAPIAHEQATAEQVLKCGLTLFVIREGDQDAHDVYQRLFRLINDKKQVFIVLNCESSQPEAMAQVLARVNTIMADKGSKYSVSDREISAIPVCPVNLSTALSGRLKGSEKLLDHCGYTALVARLEQWLAGHNHEQQQASTLRHAVRELWFQPALEVLDRELVNQEDSPVSRLQECRATLERDKRLLEHSAFTFIQQQVNCKKGDVYGICESAGNPASIQAQLQTLFADVDKRVEIWLNGELEDKSGKISTVINPPADASSSTGEKNPLKDVAWQLARERLSDEKLLTEALKLGRKWKIPLLKGRWLDTLKGWGGKAAVVIQVALSAYDIYRAGKQEDDENRAMRQQAISLGQYVETLCAEIRQSMYDTVQSCLNQIFSQRIDEVDRQIHALLEQQDQLLQDKDYLSKAMSTLI